MAWRGQARRGRDVGAAGRGGAVAAAALDARPHCRLHPDAQRQVSAPPCWPTAVVLLWREELGRR
eukprot:690639-Rhodomonas_salina.2